MVPLVRVVLGIAGCGERHELSDVPVVGGSAEQRAAIEEELHDFDGWVGAGRVRPTSIEVADFDRTAQYHRTGPRIRVSATLARGTLRTVLRHELCHALSFQEDLLDHDQPFDDLAGGPTRTGRGKVTILP